MTDKTVVTPRAAVGVRGRNPLSWRTSMLPFISKGLAHTKTKFGFIAFPFSRAHFCYPPRVLAGSEGYCELFAGGQTKSSVLQTLNHVLAFEATNSYPLGLLGY